MKLGKTKQEKEAIERAKVGKHKVFAIFPEWCSNTKRYVWLEYVTEVVEFCTMFKASYSHFEEIT